MRCVDCTKPEPHNCTWSYCTCACRQSISAPTQQDRIVAALHCLELALRNNSFSNDAARWQKVLDAERILRELLP